MHPRVLRELADVVAKTLLIVFENSWQSGEVPGEWRKGNIATIFKLPSHPESTGQQFNVQMEISDKWLPSDFHIETSTV